MTPDPPLVLLGQEPASTPPAPPAARQPRKTRKPTARKATRKTGKTPARKASRKAATPRKASKASVRKTRRAAGLQDPSKLLGGLHSSWKEAVEAHRLRVEGQFKLAESALRAHPPKAKVAERARRALKVRVKPRKGRAKDLRRIEEALDEVLSRLGAGSQ